MLLYPATVGEDLWKNVGVGVLPTCATDKSDEIFIGMAAQKINWVSYLIQMVVR